MSATGKKVPSVGQGRKALSLLLLVAACLWGGAFAQTAVDLDAGDEDVRILGAVAGSEAGFSVASGDINDDGLDDVIIGAYLFTASGGRTQAGKIYVVYGDSTRADTTIDLNDVATARLEIIGAAADYQMGRTLASGDINGDGIDDVIIGAEVAAGTVTSGTGRVYAIYGAPTLIDSTIDLSVDAANVEVIGAAENDRLGRSLAVGDVNDNNVGDLIIGASTADVGGLSDAGKVYVIFGDSTLVDTTIDLSVATANVTVNGKGASDRFGSAVASGDIDGDGIDDLVMGAWLAPSGAANGEVYMVSGNSGLAGVFDLANATLTVTGAVSGDLLGTALAVGDFNRDGIDDLLLGAPGASPAGFASGGIAYGIYGVLGLSGSIDLAQSIADFTILGRGEAGTLTWWVTAFDFTADTFDDAVPLTPFTSPLGRTSAGEGHILFGALNFPATVDLSLTSADVTILGDDDDDHSGNFAASGDLNGDGVHDLIIGAPGAAPLGRASAGEVYLIYGTTPFVALSLPDTTATYNEVLVVPVSVDSVANLYMVENELHVAFDRDLLAFDSAETSGSLTDTWALSTVWSVGASTTIDTAKISVSTTAGPAVTTTGELLRLKFTVNDVRHPITSALTFERVQFNGSRDEWSGKTTGSVMLVGTDGSTAVTVASQPGDTVRVRVTDVDLNRDALAVETFAVGLVNSATGEAETVTLTEQSIDDAVFFGTVFTVFGSGSSSIDQDGIFDTKEADSLLVTYIDSLDSAGQLVAREDTHAVVDPFGDASDNGVTQAFDAALILSHAVGSITLVGLDSLAANVDLQAPFGAIDAFDAALVVKKRLGLIARFPVQTDSSANHPQPETDNSVSKALPSERLLTLMPGDGGVISVWVDDRSDLISGDLFIEGIGGTVEMTGDLVDFQSAFRQSHDGLHFAFAGVEVPEGPGELFRIVTLDGPTAEVENIRGHFNAGQFIARQVDQSPLPALPLEFALLPNMPNPFNAETAIRFVLPWSARVRLEIFNALGQQVRTLAAGKMAAGPHQIKWNGTDDRGRAVASGLYVYRLLTPQYLVSRPMVLLK